MALNCKGFASRDGLPTLSEIGEQVHQLLPFVPLPALRICMRLHLWHMNRSQLRASKHLASSNFSNVFSSCSNLGLAWFGSGSCSIRAPAEFAHTFLTKTSPAVGDRWLDFRGRSALHRAYRHPHTQVAPQP